MKLLYPTSLKLDVSKLEGFGIELHPYDVKQQIPDNLLDAEVLVTWCNSPDNFKHAAQNMHKLHWIQSLAAGPNDVLNAGFDTKKIMVTTGSGLHDRTVAEHTLGLLLNAARRFYEMRDYQVQGKWPQHLGGPQPDKVPGTFTTLEDANITIWGFGNIAKYLAPYLTAIGAKVRGVARHAGVRNGIEIYSDDKLAEILPKTDALVMILPGSESTYHALNADRLKLLPKHAWIVNVGRGTCIDEDALNSALDNDAIGGAALDVFEKEPLPESSPLYKQKNVILSPHAAGGRPRDAEQLIADNLRRFIAGQQLKNLV
ncbi:hypothetical protein BAUCODRAFT_470845 [Baudoinia panamericana UAMH 10762]|uniref:D-isomer specific 2-hydroxyacid dehydrogenase NAD-binding domain-containing protein n=1 Tax=Baudoinia panamericana (strain UAMH 10762) TaxID=717646 RepID=M2LPM4_BAUPA|nr:uncharacterized protein BAUCODRAFT_470845 [Baudoinia panamericana UAMH 10762]EMC96352.1 hypothetical protein BAUCODRAFT_470845 [Baudoinia panamericana UAMH 10762]